MKRLFLFFTGLFIMAYSIAQHPGGPYATDENTVLLMHFNDDLTNNSTLSSDGTEQGSGMSFSSGTPANLDKCLYLDGSSYITIPHSTKLNLHDDWTIEVWIKITSFNPNAQSIIVRKPGDSEDYNSNYTLELNPWWDNILHGLYFSDAETRVNVTEMSPNLNKWYHVAFIRDVSNSKISITIHDEDWNKVSSNSQNYSGESVLLNSKDLRIGEAFEGYIDELRISNVVRSFSFLPPPLFPPELDEERINNKIKALNLHRKRFSQSPYSLAIEVLSSADYETQKPNGALSFDCGYVNEDGKVFVGEPTTIAQLKVFSDIDQAASYYMCQSFLQYYYNTPEMPIWFKTGFAAYESDMRFNDDDIKTAFNNYDGTLTSFDILNQQASFEENKGLAISYLFGEFIGVFKIWGYDMIEEVNTSTVIPETGWYNAGTIEELFNYFMRYFNARIFETNESERLILGKETENFKHYYRGAEDYWLAHFSDILEEAIKEYKVLMDFEIFEKYSSLTMPICNWVTIGGGECIDLRYTSGTAWSSGIWASSPDTDNAGDIERFEHLIRHELAHLVQTHLPANNMTAWLNEGFAEFLSRGPDSREEKDALKTETKNELDNALNYFGHLPTFEDTKVYPGQSNVDYYLLGQIMHNFIYERGGYSAVKNMLINHEAGIERLGFSSPEDFMTAYYHYVDVEYLQIAEADYFTDYEKFITKLTSLTSSALNATELNTFWDDLIATGNFPFAIGTKVAFLYRGAADKISWAGEFNGWNMNINTGKRLGVSDIWILEMEFLADTRSEYKIVRNGSQWMVDDNNPNPLAGEFQNSELWMPDYIKHTELISRQEVAKGKLTNNIKKFSSILGYTSQYRVYTPANYSTLENLPTIYVTDGQNYLDDSMGKMITVLDNLIAESLIEPVVAIFLDPRDPDNLSYDRRGYEYRNNIDFVNYVTKELIPEIEETYNVSSLADDRAIMGASYGGYNAAFFCVKASNYFHNIGINSAYLHPEGDYRIDSDLQAADLDEMKLYISYGTFDGDGDRYFNRLKNIFDGKGKKYASTIVGDGHTWKNWSRIIADALEYFFSGVENAAPVVSGIPNQTILEGNVFTTIPLDNYFTDSDNDDSEMTWSFSGNKDLKITIDGSRIATITIPDKEWNGSETITITAADPSGLNSSLEVTFTVSAVNDVPYVTNIPDQIIEKGNSFTTIQLDTYVTDLDNVDSEITWTFSGNVELRVDVDENRIATISKPEENWIGSETISFIATDPNGASGSNPGMFTSNVKTGISDIYADEMFSIYPNPAKDFVSINVPEKIHLSVLTITGQKILGIQNFQSGNVDVSGLKKGIYLVVFKSKKGILTHKLFVE